MDKICRPGPFRMTRPIYLNHDHCHHRIDNTIIAIIVSTIRLYSRYKLINVSIIFTIAEFAT